MGAIRQRQVPAVELFLFLCCIVTSVEHEWISHSDFDNFILNTGYKVSARSRIHCSSICSTEATCVSFFYISGQSQNCQLVDTILASNSSLLPTFNSKYFIPKGAQLPTTTPTTTNATAPPFTCPEAGSTNFSTVQLSDGNQFTYRIMWSQVSQSSAKASCVSVGGFLARVTTAAKMELLLQVVLCPGFGTYDYYVDGSNAAASDYTAPGAWIMDNGDPVPMSNVFWNTGCPCNPIIQHCLRMRKEAGHYFDDCYCSNVYYHICEKN